MANADAPFGLRPVRYLSGAPYNGAANMYCVPAADSSAAIFVGSLVKLAGSADANGIATVTGMATTADVVIGAVVSVIPETSNSLIYRANSTLRYVMVADDPNLVFEIQEDGAIAATAVGNTCTVTGIATGSTVTGLSAMEMDSSEVSATSDVDDDVRIIGLVQRPDNEIGTNAKWLVRLNNHAYINASVGV
jgi:hypothetical protein